MTAQPRIPLRALLVEDRDDDAELVLLELRRGGFDVTSERVETAPAMSSALERDWDIVVSDWSMPNFSAMAAFSIVKEKELDLPFIIVSGTVGEETAVAAMKIGVHDFMSKGHLSRLLPAIERELREANTRRDARKVRKQLVISERMASVGTLAASVAHEINNPLTTLIGNAEFAAEGLARALSVLDSQAASAGDTAPEVFTRASECLADAQGSLRFIQEAAERIRLVVRDLKVFSYPVEEMPVGLTDIEAVLESSIRMVWTEIRHRAHLVRNYGTVAMVEGSESRLGQIFVNLLVNAAQAVPEGKADHNEIRISTHMSDSGQVVVEIRDSGIGIPPSILPHIFDPFFTTKAAGVGTGLGLAICYRLITALNGEIFVTSEVGSGTVFRVALPSARSSTVAAAPVAAQNQSARRARILVVDDEQALRRTCQRMLQTSHDVTTIGGAKEALQMILDGTHFDAILCDLMMPEMTGMELHAELRRLQPDQADKMAFMTGGAFTEGARVFLEQMRPATIEKPFGTDRIRQFIQDCLARIR